jgi:type VI protein secretion system component Hcp
MDEPKKQPKEIEQPAEPTLLSEAALEQVAGGTKTQADAGPTESVSFAFSKIKVNYEQQ